MPDPEPVWAVEATGCRSMAADFPSHGHILTCSPQAVKYGWTYLFGQYIEAEIGFALNGTPQITEWVTIRLGGALARGVDASAVSDAWSINWVTSPSRYGIAVMESSQSGPTVQPFIGSQLGTTSLKIVVKDDGDVEMYSDGSLLTTQTIPAEIWDNYTARSGSARVRLAQVHHYQTSADSATIPVLGSVGFTCDYYQATVAQSGTWTTHPSAVTSEADDDPDSSDQRFSYYPRVNGQSYCVNTAGAYGQLSWEGGKVVRRVGGVPATWPLQMHFYQTRSWFLESTTARLGSGDNAQVAPSGLRYTTRITEGLLAATEASVFVRFPGQRGHDNGWSAYGWVSSAPVGRPLGIMANSLHVVRQGSTYTRWSPAPIACGNSVEFDDGDTEPAAASYRDVDAGHAWPAAADIYDRAELIAVCSPSLAKVMALAFFDGELLSVREGETDVSIVTGLSDDVDAYLTFMPDGRWYVGLFGDAAFRSWISDDDGATWTADRNDSGSDYNIVGVAYWRTITGFEAVAGWHETEPADDVRVFYRSQWSDAWSGPEVVATPVAGFVQPVLHYTDCGIWECAWFSCGGSTPSGARYHAPHPSESWVLQ